MQQKIAELINIIFGFRKFLLMLVLYLVGIIFRVKGLVDGAEMVDLFKTTTIAFMGANGVEHIVTTVKSYMDAKAAPGDAVVTPDEIEDAKTEAAAKEEG